MAALAPKNARQESMEPAPLLGRDEMNLAEFPIALIADRVPQGQKTIQFEDRNGRLTVTGSDQYGLPNPTDADVIVALLYLTKQKNDFKDAKVYFSRYELIRLLGWPDEGWSYTRLDESINCWHGVSLHYDGCWWNNRLKCHTDMKMHIIETVEIINNKARNNARLAGQTELPLSWFEWNKKFISSCQADNLRQLNLDEYFSLKSAIAKRLYRFLGKRFYVQGEWTFDLNEIAFERVGLSRSYAGNAGKIKAKLQPALDELEAIGFLQPLQRDDRYHRIDRGQWTIRLTRQSPALVAPQQDPPPAAEPEPPLVAELVKRGVTRATAVDLAQRHPADTIQAKIEVFDWMTEKKDKRIEKSPAGYLVKSIEKDYAAPKGFTSRAERQAQAEAKRQRDQKKDEQRRREAADAARVRADREKADAYWDALPAEEQSRLAAEALAAASASVRDTYLSMKRQGMGDGLLATIRRDYILTLIDAEQQAEPA
jgi:hypothetical protein